jgi:hypothetical protein
MVSEPHFRWRGGEITRLESFTDAVFAFAVTLPAVSLEVPRTFEELLVAMNGFFRFAILLCHPYSGFSRWIKRSSGCSSPCWAP